MKKALFVIFSILLITAGSAQARVYLAFADDKSDAFQKAMNHCMSASYHKEKCRYLLEFEKPPSANTYRWEVRVTDD